MGGMGSLFKGNGGNKGDEVSAGVPCVRYGDLYTRHEFFVTRSKACVSKERAGAYTPIRYGDVLFAASGETMEDIGRSGVNLIEGDARCAGDVLVLRPEIPAVPRYLGYAADSPASRNQKACMGRGFTVVHIYGSQLKRLLLPLPPLPEQAAIVRFLDHADRRIRRYIRAKQKLIKLLEEQKQAIIHRAVTRGLDPNVRLKPSGVEWLGDVPEHWEVVRLKALISTRRPVDHAALKSNFASGAGVMFIRIGNLTRTSINLDLEDIDRQICQMPFSAKQPRTRDAPKRYLAFDDRLSSAAVAVVAPGMERGLCKPACCLLSSSTWRSNSRWIAYVLACRQTHGQLSMYGGTKQGSHWTTSRTTSCCCRRRASKPPW